MVPVGMVENGGFWLYLRGELMGCAGRLDVTVRTESRMTPRSGTADTWGERAAGDGARELGFQGEEQGVEAK